MHLSHTTCGCCNGTGFINKQPCIYCFGLGFKSQLIKASGK